jgi:mRNA-degrading endonuclease HigB of HigAB toxin-antitoxin module
MHAISGKALREFWEGHPDAEGPLLLWYQIMAGRRELNTRQIRVLAGRFGVSPAVFF